MKTLTKPKLQKVRVKANQDVYYTFSDWPTKEIEGVLFIGVNKFMPSPDKTQTLHWMRKDSLEYIK
jgi:hypothetical protein